MTNKLHEFHKFELRDEEINAEKVITGTKCDKNVTYTECLLKATKRTNLIFSIFKAHCLNLDNRWRKFSTVREIEC